MKDSLRELGQFLESPGCNANESTGDIVRLHEFCREGDEECTKLLLRHPGIEVNSLDIMDCTPLEWAIEFSQTGIVHLLLADPRVSIRNVDWTNSRTTINKITQSKRNGDILELLLAHRYKELTSEEINQIMESTKDWESPVISEFYHHREMTARRLRRKWNIPHAENDASDIFTMHLLISEGYLRITRDTCLFKYLGKLPTELCMVFCNRIAGSSANFIPSFQIQDSLSWLLKT